MKKNKHFDYPLFADCGAPSLYNKLSRRTNNKGVMGATFSERKFDDFSYTETPEYEAYRQDYINFLLANKGKIDHYSNLDVINNPEKTYANQRILEAAGLEPHPVFHLGTDVKWLKRYLRNYEYIAIGGLIPNTTRQLIPILDRLFKENLIDDKGFPTHKLHGFACTSMPLMLRYPWYSVDSTTCRKLAVYGKITIPEFRTEKLNLVAVSARDIPLEHRVTPGVLRAINTRAEAMGTSIITLSESDIDRAVWNYLVFSEKLQKNLPAWPWSMTTRKAAEDAHEALTFYFAGVLSKKEEIYFWKKVSEYNVGSVKGRLQSFFYKKALQEAIDNKYNENGA
jgi:hypothetical protein